MVDTLENRVDPLTWNIPIVDRDGRPTQEFQAKWLQQGRANASVPDVTTAAAVSAILDLIGATKGSMLYRDTFVWKALAGAVVDGLLLTWNNTTKLPEWRVNPAPLNTPASIYIDGAGDGWMALVDANGNLILDGAQNGIYTKNPVLPAAMIPNLAGYVSGAIGSNIVNKVKGVADASSAAAGDVGEEITASVLVGAPVALTTATAANLTSINLTAGDWDVWFSPAFTGAATVCGRFIGSISLISATLDVVQPNVQQNLTYNNNVFSFGTQTLCVGPRRVNVNATTTVYGVVYSEFSGGGNTCNAYGYLRARRVR